jgi:hypothetical protein
MKELLKWIWCFHCDSPTALCPHPLCCGNDCACGCTLGFTDSNIEEFYLIHTGKTPCRVNGFWKDSLDRSLAPTVPTREEVEQLIIDSKIPDETGIFPDYYTQPRMQEKIKRYRNMYNHNE